MTKKILMLHGLAQSGEYFSSKTKGFRSELEKKGYVLYYPTAPNEYPAPDFDISELGSDPADASKILAWLKKDPINDSYELPDTTIKYLHDYVLENGPFDGCLLYTSRCV